jgi:hypothetical protein
VYIDDERQELETLDALGEMVYTLIQKLGLATPSGSYAVDYLYFNSYQ